MDRILEHIENMKQKPEHVRKRYAFSISFAVSMVILVGWLGSYGLRSSPIIADQNSPTQTNVEKPIKSLTASVFDAFKDVKDIFAGTNKFEYSSPVNVDVSAGKR